MATDQPGHSTRCESEPTKFSNTKAKSLLLKFRYVSEHESTFGGDGGSKLIDCVKLMFSSYREVRLSQSRETAPDPPQSFMALRAEAWDGPCQRFCLPPLLPLLSCR